MLGWVRNAWRNIVDRGGRDRELEHELTAYIELLTAEKIAAGAAPDEARRQALLEVGGIDQVRERVGDVRAGSILDVLFKDVRYGARLLVRSPVTTVIAAATIAIAIGANAAVFSLAHTLLLSQLPLLDPDRVVAFEHPPLTIRNDDFALSRSVRESNAFESAALYYRGSGANLEDADAGRRINVAQVDASFMRTLGAKLALGRDFRPEEAVKGVNTVVLLSHNLWQHVGGERTIVGRQIGLSGVSYTVVGVLTPGFTFPAATDAWIPLPTRDELFGAAAAPDAIGRLRAGVTAADAKLRVARTYEERNGRPLPEEQPLELLSLHEQLSGPIRLPLLLLFGAVTLVLLIGCANVAALLLARVSARDTEFVLRGVLGASANRIVRQLLTEVVLLIGLGVVLGLLAAPAALGALVRLFPADLLPSQNIVLSRPAILYSLAITTICALLIACAPALRAALVGRLMPRTTTATAGRGRQRFRSALLTAEIALSVLLVIGAGLLTRSLIRLQQIPIGFQPDGVVSLQLRLPQSRYDSPEKQNQYVQQLLERVRALPGVHAAGMTSGLPLSKEMGVIFRVTRADAPDSEERARRAAKYTTATPEYLEAIGAQLLRGPGFTADNTRAGQPTIVITDRLARQLFGRNDPIGHRVRVRTLNREYEVVGVIADLRHTSLTMDTGPLMIESLVTAPTHYLALAARTSGSTDALIRQLRDVLNDVDRNVPPYNLRTMRASVASSLGTRHLLPVVVSLFALTALLLCALGVYGLATELVIEQRRALCIRKALGAQTSAVLRLVAQHALRAAGIGTALGLAAGLIATRLLQSMLYETDPLDPLTFAMVPVVILGITLVATAAPAYRAAVLDPGRMLRE